MATRFSIVTNAEVVDYCPRCNKRHLTSNLYCEHCLYSFLDEIETSGFIMCF